MAHEKKKRTSEFNFDKYTTSDELKRFRQVIIDKCRHDNEIGEEILKVIRENIE